VRVIAWNVERKRPTTPTGEAAARRVHAEQADVVVFTEARVGHLRSSGGYELVPGPVAGGWCSDV